MSEPKPPRPPVFRRPRPRPRATVDAIADAMLEHIAPPPALKRPRAPELTTWSGFPADAARFIEREPNAFLFGAIFDRMVDANIAWESPYLLAQRLGHLDVGRLAKMSSTELAPFMGRYRGERALHRFTNTMARQVVAASKRLLADYAGTAANIWPAWTPAATVIVRLNEFDGISHKLAHMTARLLVTYYGVPLTDWTGIDIAEDRHVARVFLRTGLVPGTPGKKTYRVAEIRDGIISTARRLSPTYPGALDEPAFMVGRGWCNAGRAWCTDGTEPCPLAGVCSQERADWEIVG